MVYPPANTRSLRPPPAKSARPTQVRPPPAKSARPSAHTRSARPPPRSSAHTRSARPPPRSSAHTRSDLQNSILLENKRTVILQLDKLRTDVSAIQLTKPSLIQPKIKLLRKIDDTVATIGYKTLLTKTQIDDTNFIINSLHDEFEDLTRENKSSGRFGGTKRKKWGRPPF